MAGRRAPDPDEPDPGHTAGAGQRRALSAGLPDGLLAAVGAPRLPALLPPAAVPLAAAGERALAHHPGPARRRRQRHQEGR